MRFQLFTYFVPLHSPLCNTPRISLYLGTLQLCGSRSQPIKVPFPLSFQVIPPYILSPSSSFNHRAFLQSSCVFFFFSFFPLLLCSTYFVCIVYCIDTNAFSVCLDVGGGSVPNDTPHSLARIPLRWMVRECFLAKTVSLLPPLFALHYFPFGCDLKE